MKESQSSFRSLPEEVRNCISIMAQNYGVDVEKFFQSPMDDECLKSKTITKKDAARIANISIDTISRRIKDGTLKCMKTHPGRNGAVRILTESFIVWLNWKA